MANARRYDPRMDELLRRSRAAVLHSEELIAKTRELARQTRQLSSEKTWQRDSESFPSLQPGKTVPLPMSPRTVKSRTPVFPSR
jgi:hypothetical protein